MEELPPRRITKHLMSLLFPFGASTRTSKFPAPRVSCRLVYFRANVSPDFLVITSITLGVVTPISFLVTLFFLYTPCWVITAAMFHSQRASSHPWNTPETALPCHFGMVSGCVAAQPSGVEVVPAIPRPVDQARSVVLHRRHEEKACGICGRWHIIVDERLRGPFGNQVSS